MTRVLANLVYSFCVLGSVSLSVSASLRGPSQEGKCEAVHRHPPSSFTNGCGNCLSGYRENVNKACLLDCPAELQCNRRQPCSYKTGGKCGRCKQEYLDVEGSCITDEEVKYLTEKIERLLYDRRAGEKDGNAGAATSPAALQLLATPPQPAVVQSTTEQPNKSTNKLADPKAKTNQYAEQDVPAADKRVAAAVSSDTSAVKMDDAADKTESTIGFNKLLFFGIVAGASLLCVLSLVIAGVCWYRVYKIRKSMKPAEYVGYGDAGSPKGGDSLGRSDSSGDRKLAHSAQMYHYQHHKQQMLALEKSLSDKLDESDAEDAEENEDGNYTVYECPGLAQAGEMEVSNPLFQASKSPPSASPSTSSTASPSSPPQRLMAPSQEVDQSAAVSQE